MTILSQILQSQAQKEVVANANFSAVAPAGIFAQKFSTTSGLTWGYYGGVIKYNGVITIIPDGTLNLDDNATNYVELSADGTVSSNTTGFTAGKTQLYTITTSSGTISAISDKRILYVNNDGSTSIDVSGNSDLTLDEEQAACKFIALTGTLTGNIDVIIPDVPAFYAVNNQTSGVFSTTWKTSSGAGVPTNQGAQTLIYCDGVDTYDITSSSAVSFPITLSQGGTNASLTADNGGIVYSDTSGFAILAPTATANEMLLSGASGAPSWSASTWVSTITVNGILYGSGANAVGQITTANNGILATDGSGIPSIASTLPSAVQSNITSVGTLSSGVWNATAITEAYGGTNQTTYTLGDILFSSAANTLSKLSGNTTSTKKFLRQTGTGAVSAAPAWDTVVASDISGSALTKTDDTNVILTLGGSPSIALLNPASITVTWTGQLAEARGGTNQSSYAQGDILYASATNTLSKLPKSATSTRYLANTGTSNSPNWDQINLANGVTGTLPVANGGTGVTASDPIIQRVSTIVSSVATGSTQIPVDNTIPQNTEGDQYMSLSITPKSSSNILVIDCQIECAHSGGGLTSMSLFQDSTANSLSAVHENGSGTGAPTLLHLRHIMTAGTTSSTTFKIRAGGGNAGTLTFNGSGGSGLFGGVMNSYMMITEYAA